jgi:hypothetical protein
MRILNKTAVGFKCIFSALHRAPAYDDMYLSMQIP